MSQPQHVPMTRAEADARGWSELDVIFITGDPHVDHPSFPASLLARVLEAEGYRVGILSRPAPGDPASVTALGKPRLFFAVTAGALDSMVANHTSLKRPRGDDPYAPGGIGGGRPDRALTVYCNLVRQAFGKQAFIVAGGLEAGLRRFAHYDFWSDSVRRPILMDCGADLLVHGQGEEPLVALAAAFAGQSGHGLPDAVREIPGVVWRQPASAALPAAALELPAAEEVAADPRVQARAFHVQEQTALRRQCQAAGGMRVVANPAWEPTVADLDRIFALPFTRNPHPCYLGERIPALEQVRFSVTTHRGCLGGCAFCAVGRQQGPRVVSRTPESVLAEVGRIVQHPEFRGTVNDLGGPTANMYGVRCTRPGGCGRVSCLWPERCAGLDADQSTYLGLLREAARLPGVRHLFVTTGVRMDLALDCIPLVEALAFHHTSGHLKVAPEHVSFEVLRHMRKPSGSDFERFLTLHGKLSVRAGKRQFVLPYLMAAHPGCRMEHMADLALFLHDHDVRAEQVQIFTPTPGTAASVMYATGLDPATLAPVFVERDPRQRSLQKALLLFRLPENADAVREALQSCGRMGLARVLLPRRGRGGSIGRRNIGS